MSTKPYEVRAANLMRPPRDRTVDGSATSINLGAKWPKYRLTSSGTPTIATINCGNLGDGYVLILRVKTGSGTITLSETGNIVVNGTTLALGANDSVMLEYDKADAKWYAIGNYNV